jgi:hypothetical protein
MTDGSFVGWEAGIWMAINGIKPLKSAITHKNQLTDIYLTNDCYSF